MGTAAAAKLNPLTHGALCANACAKGVRVAQRRYIMRTVNASMWWPHSAAAAILALPQMDAVQ